MVRVRVPATTANLGPGFDCLGMAVAIYNHVSIDQIGRQSLRIDVTGSASTADIPVDESNLVYRAAKQVFKLAGKNLAGVQLKLEIEAPLARGLGSSASAIVGGMFAANEFLRKPLTIEQLAWEVTAMEGHPDNVISCLVGGLTASIWLDKSVVYEKIHPAGNLRCVFFIPDYELETATARGVMPKDVALKDAVFNSSRIPFILSRLRSGDLADLNALVDDRLHQPYRIPLIKGYDDVRQAALAAGASAVCISGAGPTILAICDSEQAGNVAAAGAAALEKHDVNVDCRTVAPDLAGCVAD